MKSVIVFCLFCHLYAIERSVASTTENFDSEWQAIRSTDSTPWPTATTGSSSTRWDTTTISTSSRHWSTTGRSWSSTPQPTTATSTMSTDWPTSSVSPSSPGWSTSTSPSVPPFDKISILLARNIDLQSTSSPNDFSTTITCDDPTILPYVRANVTQDSTLIVSATAECDVVIRAPFYQTINIESVATLRMTGYFPYRGYQLKLISMGNSQIQIANMVYDVAEFIFLGNSAVKLSGNVDKLTIVSRGKGSIDATSVVSPNVNATLAGSGSLQLKSTADMNLIVHGIGNLNWCSPKVQIDVVLDSYQQKNIVYRC